MNAETVYLEYLPKIERIAASVARKKRLNADDCGEFVQMVCVRLIEDDYSIIRKFQGRSKLSTYLMTVIGHIFSQWRVEQWGKWRPSAEARRLGDLAVDLERLMTRDGYSFSEAVNILTTPAGATCTPAQLELLYVRLPNRSPRPILVSGDTLPDAISVDGDAEERAESYDRAQSARHITAELDKAITRFADEDRLILEMRFCDSKRVPEIARALGRDQKKLYKYIEKLLDRLRDALQSAGISREEVEQLLLHPDQEIHLDILSHGENPRRGPSHREGEVVRGGKKKLP